MDAHAAEFALPTDLPPLRETATRAPVSTKLSPAKQLAYKLFGSGAALDAVLEKTGLSRGTVGDYLADFIRAEKPASIARWVAPELLERIAASAREYGTARLKPVYIALNEEASYETIRIAFAFLDSTAAAT